MLSQCGFVALPIKMRSPSPQPSWLACDLLWLIEEWKGHCASFERGPQEILQFPPDLLEPLTPAPRANSGLSFWKTQKRKKS